MTYLSNHMLPGEVVVFRATIHRAYIRSITMIVLASQIWIFGPHATMLSTTGWSLSGIHSWVLVILFYAVWDGLWAIILIRNTDYAITNKRVVLESWQGGRILRVASLGDVSTLQMEIDQNIVGRMCGFAALRVVGSDGQLVNFPYCCRAHEFRARLTAEAAALSLHAQDQPVVTPAPDPSTTPVDRAP